jgi:hypothetical protein
LLDDGDRGDRSDERDAGKQNKALGKGLGHGGSVAHEAATVDG